MAAILGIGRSTYRNYEAGSIPQLPIARLIQLAADKKNILVLARLSSQEIPSGETVD